MQQRRLRLGDILDDYCPRERRITNHAVVAMIDDQVKQTRCTTCDADHVYKEARMPSPRRKKDPGVLSDVQSEGPRAVRAEAEGLSNPPDQIDEPAASVDGVTDNDALADAIALADVAADDDEPSVVLDEDEGPVHRPLIRATLPRQEGQPSDWKEPDFTVRQPGRGGREFDGNRGGGNGSGGQGGQRHGRNRRPMRAGGGQGNNGSGSSRFGGQRHGNSRQGAGQGSNHGSHHDGNRGQSRGGDHRGPGRKRGR